MSWAWCVVRAHTDSFVADSCLEQNIVYVPIMTSVAHPQDGGVGTKMLVFYPGLALVRLLASRLLECADGL